MDIATTAAVATAAAATIKTPDPESETPTRIQPIKPLPFTNGVLKRHQPLHHHHHLNGPPVVITYKECLKNHAASLGGHAVDGCGEFMPSPTATHVDPTSLKCAACGCHRNFHRREPDDIHPAPNPAPAQHVIEYQPHHRHHPPPPPPSRGGGANSSSPNSPSPPPISSSYYPSAPHMLLALSAGLPQENSLPIPTTPGTGATPTMAANSNGRKRFRTKFTPDQKEKMHEFAEKVGWKMQKRDEEIITGFCNEIGVDKGVFKVWMHNNKSTFGKKSDTDNNGNHNGTSGGDRINNFGTNGIENNHHFNNNHHHHHHHDHEDTGNSHSNHHHQFLHNNGSVSTGNVVATNGSSSS